MSVNPINNLNKSFKAEDEPVKCEQNKRKNKREKNKKKDEPQKKILKRKCCPEEDETSVKKLKPGTFSKLIILQHVKLLNYGYGVRALRFMEHLGWHEQDPAPLTLSCGHFFTGAIFKLLQMNSLPCPLYICNLKVNHS